MTQQSMFWNTNDVGDGADSGFDATAIAGWMRTIFARGSSGVLKRVGNELAASGTATPLDVDTGAAIVYGLFYENSAALELTVTTPSTGTTGGRVNLKVDWSAQTVRAAIQLNTDGTAAIPALVQTAGTEWNISLATFTITTGGVITLTDVREFCAFANSARPDQIILAGNSVIGKSDSGSGAGEAITASADGNLLVRNSGELGFGQVQTDGIADDAVTADKVADDLEVVAAQIADDAVETGNIANGSATTGKIADGAVETGNIANGAASTVKIADGAVETGEIADSGVETGNFANDAVDDTKIGNRVANLYRRQGGSATVWETAGTTEYTPGAVYMVGGVKYGSIADGATYGDIAMPVQYPTLTFLTIVDPDPSLDCVLYYDAGSNLFIRVSRASSSGLTEFLVNWLMIEKAYV